MDRAGLERGGMMMKKVMDRFGRLRDYRRSTAVQSRERRRGRFLSVESYV
jgi:hypothetical protein